MKHDELSEWLEETLAQLENDTSAIGRAFEKIAALAVARAQAPIDLAILQRRLG